MIGTIFLIADVFSYTIDKRALKRAQMLDGKLILVSNVPDLDPTTLVGRYKVSTSRF